ncbi:BatD family protein [Verrucomicrobiaceae bacterium N1E253]|uniref:BatD family protein n=1 Tax=Oceaniferula marina TaxID=2748318 RepID=A0A851GG19_9BACT|nr:BatD family protein [Oceaniferula marina]NWK54215.1 BatD family protein [Oceaniferula marina]
MYQRIPRVWAILLTGLICSQVLLAQSPKIHVGKSTKSFFVGESFTYEILVSGAKKVEVSEPESNDELSIRFLEKVEMPQTNPPSVAVRYRMIPMIPGTIMMPVLEVQADEEVLLTEEEDMIDVAKPEVYPGLRLERELPQRDLYVGEPFQVNYVWKSPLPLSGFRAIQLQIPLFYDHRFSIRSPHHWIDGDDKAAIGFPVSNTRLIARYEAIQEAGVHLNTVSFAKIAIPKREGEISLQPATLLGSYIAPPENQKRVRGWQTNYPSYFNNNFFESIDHESFAKYYVSSPRQTLRVLPLPLAGKPDDFAGQVGNRSVTVEASPKVVSAGDPITLTIVVEGCPYPEVVELPSLSEQLAFTRQFTIPPKQSRGKIEGQSITFVRTLRPKGQDVTAIPAIRLPYFDPASKQYGVAASDPIPITVKASEMATAFDAQLSGSDSLRNQVIANNEGIQANFQSLTPDGLFGLSRFQCLLVFSLMPPLVFAAIYLASRSYRLRLNDPVRARSASAMRRFRRNLARVSAAAPNDQDHRLLLPLNQAMRGYFADQLNLVEQAHTFSDLEKRLGGRIDPELLEQLKELYTKCQEPQFCEKAPPPTSDDLRSLIRTVQTTITRIDQSI